MKVIIDIPIDTDYHIKKRNISQVDIDIAFEAIRKGIPIDEDMNKRGRRTWDNVSWTGRHNLKGKT